MKEQLYQLFQGTTGAPTVEDLLLRVGVFMAAAIGSVAVFVVMLILGRVRNDVRTLLVVRAARTQELPVEGKV